MLAEALQSEADEVACRELLKISKPQLGVHDGVFHRPLADGGGLCSPGRWQPEDRSPPQLKAAAAVLDNIAAKWSLDDMVRGGALHGFTPCGGPGACWRKFCRPGALCGEVTPWKSEGLLEEIHSKLSEMYPAAGWEVPQGQPFRALAIDLLLAECGDPDADWFKDMAIHTVDIGLDEPLPRNPLISRQSETEVEIKRVVRGPGACI